jgi:hypothetical protein
MTHAPSVQPGTDNAPTQHDHPTTSKQQVFRSVNDKIARALADFDPDQPTLFICECSTPGCAESVQATLHHYRASRQPPGFLLLAPAHQRPAHNRRNR